MRATLLCYGTLSRKPRVRSHLLDATATSSPLAAAPLSARKPRYGPKRVGELPTDDRARYDPLLRILSSPLRRCMLTNKVLPCDTMLRFQLTRPPPSTEPPSTGRNKADRTKQQLLLEPSKVLHPRFDPAAAGSGGQTTGKGLWVTCWSEAVEALAKKGSYKRLHPSASMSDPALLSAQIHSQLARRVVQEVEMLAERIKSWPAAGLVASWEDVPVRRLRREDLTAGGLGRILEEDLRIVAALDLSPSEAETFTEPLCTFVPASPSGDSTPTQRDIPVYRLSNFLRSVLLPPDSLRSFRPRAETLPEDEPNATTAAEAQLLTATREPLQNMLALLARRFERERESRGEVEAGGGNARVQDEESNRGEVFALVAPRSPSTAGERARAEVVVPLAVALWRLRLWIGEGWKGE
ncbi:hypothetical protein JCM10908_003633 [Rhodotorula pacifica]|uniref:uncharacterized protein n=1 Tax=Rhodotorula pacifica TaxID=1495444 RepID=UPI0031822B9F